MKKDQRERAYIYKQKPCPLSRSRRNNIHSRWGCCTGSP